MLPLEGIRVLDCSRLLPGPYASLILAELGAEVIKVEDFVGDYIRAMPPHVDGISGWFAALNRNKKSVVINLKAADGVEAFLRLVETADIVLESFRPGVMDRLGTGYTACKERNPKIIYCAITGYGYDSPLRDRAGHDINYLALSGVLGVTGSDRDGGPQISGAQIADVAGGSLMSVISILAALRNAEKHGQGQFIDSAMCDGSLAPLTMVLGAHMSERAVGQAISNPPNPGTMQLNGRYCCYRVYQVQDGYVSLGALEPKFWQNFCQAFGRDDLLGGAFEDARAGQKSYDEVCKLFMATTRNECSELNSKFDFCCEPILDFDEVAAHPHFAQRGLFFDLESESGKLPQIGVPLGMRDAVRKTHELPPGHGADTYEILKQLGIDDVQLQLLKDSGAIQ